MAKVKLNLNGFRQVRQHPAVMDEITRQAESITDRANRMSTVDGAEYEAAPATRTDRGSIALASTGNGTDAHGKAMVDNAKNNTLLKALG